MEIQLEGRKKLQTKKIRPAQLSMNRKSIKIIQINKGNSQFMNRVDQINHMISQHKPQIVIINKLNIENGDIISRNQFDNFKNGN